MKIRVLLATLVMIPLLALGANVDASSGAIHPGTPQMTGQNPYECCWVIIMGKWRCVPC